MKLNRQEKEIVRRKFCAYCIKVLHGEALNYLDELERQRKREVNFSELLQKDLDALYCCDDYDLLGKSAACTVEKLPNSRVKARELQRRGFGNKIFFTKVPPL